MKKRLKKQKRTTFVLFVYPWVVCLSTIQPRKENKEDERNEKTIKINN